MSVSNLVRILSLYTALGVANEVYGSHSGFYDFNDPDDVARFFAQSPPQNSPVSYCPLYSSSVWVYTQEDFQRANALRAQPIASFPAIGASPELSSPSFEKTTQEGLEEEGLEESLAVFYRGNVPFFQTSSSSPLVRHLEKLADEETARKPYVKKRSQRSKRKRPFKGRGAR